LGKDSLVEDIHKIIRKVFHLQDDPLGTPVGGRIRYNREHFPELFSKLGFTVGAEIGVRLGKFSAKICRRNRDLKLYCIDPWLAYQRYSQEVQDEIYKTAQKNLEGCNVGIIKKFSMDALEDFKDKSLDFVCIDGNHEFEYAVMDIIFWSKKVRSGGLLLVHDYHYNRTMGVHEAVDAYTHANRIIPWYVTKELQPTAFWVKP
jgi:hypothetical protein